MVHQPMELVSQAERRKLLVAVPKPVDEHLELLLRAARLGGAQASRSQLLAALVVSAPTAVPDVRDLVLEYLTLQLPDLRARHPEEALPEIRHPGPKRRSR